MLHLKSEMDDYQIAAGEFLDRVPRCALWIDMGLGKTIIVLTKIVDWTFSFQHRKTLVVSKPKIVRKTWPDEIKEWEHTRHLTCQVLDGTPQEMWKQIQLGADIDLISAHQLRKLAVIFRKAKTLPWDAIVIDESSMFRNPDSKRWKFLYWFCMKVKRVIEMTGTPAPNGLQQTWAQIALLDDGERLGYTYGGFLERYFDSDPYSHKTEPKKFANDRIKEKIADICYTLRDKDHGSLPPVLSRVVWVDIGDKARKLYERMERDAIIKFDDQPHTIKAMNAGALYGKLLELANGAMYHYREDKTEKKTWSVFHDAKLDELEELLDITFGSPVFVGYNYEHDRDRMLARFPHARVIKTNKDQDDWNDGKIELAIAHPASVGFGLNLQRGGHIVTWFGLPLDLEQYLQFIKRLNRRGQENRVIVNHLIARGTAEEDAWRSLQKKEVTQDDLMDAMRRRVQDILRELGRDKAHR